MVSKKIRIFPDDPDKYFKFLHLYRRAYNLTIETFKEKIKPSSELRSVIVKKCIEDDNFSLVNVNLIQEGYRKACSTRQSLIRKRVKKQTCDYHFMSWKYSPRSFNISRLGKDGSIYNKSLGAVTYTEDIPKEAIGKSALIKFENGEWYISVKDTVDLKKLLSKNSTKVVALDPGVRTFMTSYSQNDSVKYGEDFCKEKLVPHMLRLRRLISLRDKLLLNKKEFIKQKKDVPKWLPDRLLNVYRMIDRARSKHSHLVSDLHRRVAYDLVQNNDVLLLPTFEIKSMVRKSGVSETGHKVRTKEDLNKITVSSMLSLRHYDFKLTLRWMAKKYGKVVLDVNEAYTSRTLWDGFIKNDLGSAKHISYKGKILDRDVNGARNVLIRFLTLFTKETVPRVPRAA